MSRVSRYPYFLLYYKTITSLSYVSMLENFMFTLKYVGNITQADMSTMVMCTLLLPVYTVVAMSAVLEHLSPDFQLIVATAGFLSLSPFSFHLRYLWYIILLQVPLNHISPVN